MSSTTSSHESGTNKDDPKQLESELKRLEVENEKYENRISNLGLQIDALARHQSALFQLLTESLSFTKSDRDHFLKHITVVISQSLEVDRASFWKLSEDRQQLRCLELFDRHEQIHSSGKIIFREEFPSFFKRIETSETIDAIDSANGLESDTLSVDSLSHSETTSAIYTPLWFENRLRGVLHIEQRSPDRKWKSHEILFAEKMAHLVTTIWKNTGQIQNHPAHSETIVETSNTVETAKNLQSQYVAKMCHELRTPLNSIMGFTGILIDELSGPLNREQSRQLKIVQENSERLLDLIEDILDNARLDINRLSINKSHIKVSDSIQRVKETMIPLADKKELQLIVNVDLNIGMVVTDPKRYEQILINLLSNAVKFTEAGIITLDAFKEKDRLITKVTDTGNGIPTDDLVDIFKTFHQSRSAMKGTALGTGLGLTISSKLANLLGGEIQVESHVGEGSVFTLILPYSD